MGELIGQLFSIKRLLTVIVIGLSTLGAVEGFSSPSNLEEVAQLMATGEFDGMRDLSTGEAYSKDLQDVSLN